MKKILPFLLFTLGVILVVGAGFLVWHLSRPLAVGAGVDVPRSIAGYALTSTQAGEAGIASISQLHFVEIPLTAGVVAEYGQDNATLWLADAGSAADALEMIRTMESKIASDNSPFTPMGVFQFQNRDVYLLTALGKTHFYAQSGGRVFWLEIAPGLAEQAMKELLAYYP